MRLFKRLRRKLGYLSDEHIEKIHQAYLVAFEAHKEQKRRTGEPYITHPVAVACILADMKMDAQTLMAALMHDVIEDTQVQKRDLVEQFGQTVADLVDGVSKLTQIEFVSRLEAQAENFRKMVLAMAQDIRVILIKLADRLHNMRTLGSMPVEKRHRIARETLEIFAPVAKRLGMRDFSVELEELGFMALYPNRYAILKESVARARGNRKKVLNLIDKSLHEAIANSSVSTCVVKGREKHLYSIYRKMRNKKIPFNEIMDVYAFRIVVDSVDTCYRVLGLVHGLFKPVPERFKDYIAIPKANGYQSLHTTLFGPYGLPIEVQIRTTDMERTATSGIASHWLYKQGDALDEESQVHAQRWVRNLLELQQSSGNSIEFIESVKIDLFPGEVYVFTPNGDIRELPLGATAIDFAYSVHTDIGNRCVAVKVDRQPVPLSTVLTSGQTIEVISSERARPNPAWLDFVVTSKARAGIRHYLKSQHKTESVSLGRQLLERALVKYGLVLDELPLDVTRFIILESKVTSLNNLLAEIGLGNRAPMLVAKRISDVSHQVDRGELDEAALEEKPLTIKGTEGMVVNFPECCSPIPGDPIMGVLNAGKGIMVHVDKCAEVARMRRTPDQCIALRWSDDVKKEFTVKVEIEVINRRGVLAILALAVSDADGNIEDINLEESDGRHYLVRFKLLVRDRLHLAAVLKSLRQVPLVTRITRSK